MSSQYDKFIGNRQIESVARDHAQKVRSLEEKQVKRMVERYKNVRQDLRDRLDFFGAETFSAQQARQVLVQVETALVEMERILGIEIGDSAEEISEMSVEHLKDEVEKWQKEFTGAVIPINLDAALITSEVNNLLLSKYESSLQSYSSSLRQRITNGLTESILQESSLGEVVQKIGRTFMGEEWKLLQIARTELHNVYSVAKLKGMGQTKERFIPNLKKTLFHPMDARTGEDSKFVADKDLIVDIDKPFVYRWKKEIRTYMAPPDRPNDRSILIPYSEDWADE